MSSKLKESRDLINLAPLRAVGVAAIVLFLAILTLENLRNEVVLAREIHASEWAGREFDSVYVRASNFSGADLRGLRIKKGDFRDVDFSRSDLRGAYFEQSLLGTCDFRGADLRDAVFITTLCFDCRYNSRTKLPFPKENAEKMGLHYVD